MSAGPPALPGAIAAELALDEAQLAALRAEAKRTLRASLRAVRSALPPAAAAARSRAASERLADLPFLARARSVALYAAVRSRRELDLSALDAVLRARGLALYYPFLDPHAAGARTGFRLTERQSDLVDRGHRFPEPRPDSPEAAPGTLDVIVAPALGFAPDGHRLGHGAGFYDVTLPEHCPPAIPVVVGFDFQLLVELPVEPHDVRCAWVVTDARTLAAAPVAGPGAR